MASPLELLSVLGGIKDKKIIVMGTGVLLAAGAVAYSLSGGREVSPTVSDQRSGNDKSLTSALLAKTRTPSAVKSSTREPTRIPTKENLQPANIITQNMTRYSPVSSPQFPPACQTNQFGKPMYMEEGGGTAQLPDGRFYTAWKCKNGRIMNPANPVKPGTWH